MSTLQEWYGQFLEKTEMDAQCVEAFREQVNFRHKIEEMRNHVVKETSILFKFLNRKSVLDDDIPFLEQLLYKRYNSIASGGQSPLSKETLTELLNNKDFMKALKTFMVTPSSENFIAFQEVWKKLSVDLGKTFPKLLCNRVACACTYAVSTVPDENKFNKLLNWLVGEGHILINDENYKNWDWFTKNVFLMNEIRRVLQLEDVEINYLYSSSFVWTLFEHYAQATGSVEADDNAPDDEETDDSVTNTDLPSNSKFTFGVGFIPEDCEDEYIPSDGNTEEVYLDLWETEKTTITGYVNGEQVTLVSEHSDFFSYDSKVWQEVIDTFLAEIVKKGRGLTADDLTTAWTFLQEEDLDEDLYENFEVPEEESEFFREDYHNGKFFFRIVTVEILDDGEEDYFGEKIVIYS